MFQDDDSKKPQDLESENKQAEKWTGEEPGWLLSGMRKLVAKKWALPAIYLTAAALIITVMYGQATHLAQRQPSADTTATSTMAPPTQPWIWPVAADSTSVKVERGYYDASVKDVSVATLANNLVHYDNSYQGSTGIDLGSQNGKLTFGVVAAASGTVESIVSDPVMGETVTIQGNNGYTAIYQSLGSVSVAQGDKVLQGQLIGSSGTNMKEAALGNHLFFAIEKNNAYVDPEQLLPQASA